MTAAAWWCSRRCSSGLRSASAASSLVAICRNSPFVWQTTQVPLIGLPNTAGQPAIPSLPMKPTSTAEPSLIRTNSDSAPVSGK